MLTKVEVRTQQGNLLGLQLDDISDGFIVQDIEGLDPVKATLVSSGFAGLDGEQYQSSRRETRNIKIQLGLVPDADSGDSVRDLRKRLYSFFMPKSEVSLRFIMDDGLDVDISGVVESLETAMFTQEPAVDISLICFDPDFYDPTPETVTGLLTTDLGAKYFDYEGTVETGIKIVVNVNRTVTELTVYQRLPSDEIVTMQFSAPLVAGDVLTISTVPGDKGATLTRAGTASSVLYGVSPQSRWFELLPGRNGLRVYAVGAAMSATIEYLNKYGGL